MRSRLAWPYTSLAVLLCTSAAVAEVSFKPHIDISQILNVASAEDDQVYSELSAGIDLKYSRQRAQAQISYDYGRRIAERGNVATENRHTLTAKATADIVKGWLSVDAGAYAGLQNRDPRAGVAISGSDSRANLTQTFSGFVEPKLSREIGGETLVEASYRLGAASAGGRSATTGAAGGGIGLPNNEVPIDRTARSVSQEARLRLSGEAATRVSWSASAEALRENSKRLDQLYRTYRGTIETQIRLTRAFGLVASGGYEDILNTEQAFLTDVNGRPIADVNGDFQVDPLAPRRLVFSRVGATYEGGVVWAPSRRTSFRIRYGKVFGGNSLNGEVQYRVSSRLGMTGTFQQGIESFGRLLTRDIAGVPTSFIISDQQAAGLGECIIGVDPATGGCIGNATQAVTSAQFRSQAAQFIIAGKKGRTTYSLTSIYNRRRFLDSRQLQTPTGDVVDPTLTGRADQSIAFNARINRRLAQRSTISLSAFAQRYQFALASSRNDSYFGGTLGYNQALGRNLEFSLTGTANRQLSTGQPATTRGVVTAGLRARF